jgi:hypothetical protein
MGCTCFKHFYLEGACKARLELTKEFNVEFENWVEQEEFLNICDVSHSTKVGKIFNIFKFSILIEPNILGFPT